jgi:hypothetical protein
MAKIVKRTLPVGVWHLPSMGTAASITPTGVLFLLEKSRNLSY